MRIKCTILGEVVNVTVHLHFGEYLADTRILADKDQKQFDKPLKTTVR